jgi:homoserine kinase
MPRTAQLVAALRAEGLAGVVSGAGPSALTLTTADRVPDVERIAASFGGWDVHDRPVHQHGVQWRAA